VDLNPQARQMADESMVRNLEAQAQAIWPQEVRLIERYALPETSYVLDAGCGTGEIASRVAALYPRARVLGVDVLDDHLERARLRYAGLAPRLRFEHQSVFALDAADGTFDLTLCRHVLHSIPHPDRVLAELARVTRPGGRLHLIPEDYGMLHFQRGALDPRDFWHVAPAAMGTATGTDLFVGRNTYGMLASLGLDDITVDYVTVDTLRMPRETFATILEAWRDGYAESIGQTTPISEAEARAYFDAMIANVRDPLGYALWLVPIVSARIPHVPGRRGGSESGSAVRRGSGAPVTCGRGVAEGVGVKTSLGTGEETIGPSGVGRATTSAGGTVTLSRCATGS
jgi:ubiquinone/menaquinone biosynthesis C-methylase UbiE